MQLIILLIIIIKSAYGREDLNIPTYVSVSIIEPLGLFVQWRKVRNDVNNPVLGFKIRLWKIEEDFEGTFTLLDKDRLAIISDERATDPYNPKCLPKQQPREYLSPFMEDKNDINIMITDIKYNTIYEVRVLAYRKNEDGPMTDPIRVKITKGDDYMAMVQRESTSSCTVVVVGKVSPKNGITYSHLEHVYL